ncbi:RHS repeat-associated core domain-containing protein [Eubacterium uniforme]|uniref:RHS repeat-associated core domain-containing protein n=2 Tax=Eubacterium uniforme TaxID=39495 RepID=A0A1T4V4H2_9FIRM|nr:RHS repeat-associated core domain-containing protein [Eubacterium uniforme]
MDLVSYTGYGYNALSNLYLAVNRIYDYTTRSYMQKDKGQPTVIRPSSFETYAYVENNPVNYVDPYGLSIISKVGSWVSDTADAFVSTVKKAAGAVKDAVVDAAEGIKDAVVDAAHELVTDIKNILKIDSRIFKSGIQAGVGAAFAIGMGFGIPAAIACAFAAVAVGAVLGVGAHAVKTFVTGGTYDDFLCGLEDSIYSGADFMTALFMTTAMAGYGECKKIDKAFDEYDKTSKAFNGAKEASKESVSVNETEKIIENDKFDELLNNEYYKNTPGYDCSEIAEDFYEKAGDKGIIYRIEGKNGSINGYEYGRIENYVYHDVYSDGKYIYDPRFSNSRILKDDYFRKMNEINDGGFYVYERLKK